MYMSYLQSTTSSYLDTLKYYFLNPLFSIFIGWIAFYVLLVVILPIGGGTWRTRLKNVFPNYKTELFIVIFLMAVREFSGVSTLAFRSSTASGATTFFGWFFGGVNGLPEASLLGNIVFSVLWVLGADLGWWTAHYLTHKVPVFWDFHKIHHSPTELNPFTAFRFHPIEATVLGASIIIFGTFTSLAFSKITGTIPSHFAFFGVPLFFLLYHTVSNFRHSNVWISFGKFEYMFSSPACHQIHHSSAPEHQDKNFGQYLQFWDWVFGTLYRTGAKENLKFGIGKEGLEVNQAKPWELLWLPFIGIWRRVRNIHKPTITELPDTSST